MGRPNLGLPGKGNEMGKIEKMCLLKAWFDDGKEWDDMPQYMKELLFTAYGNLFCEVPYWQTHPCKEDTGIDWFSEDGEEYEYIA